MTQSMAVRMRTGQVMRGAGVLAAWAALAFLVGCGSKPDGAGRTAITSRPSAGSSVARGEAARMLGIGSDGSNAWARSAGSLYLSADGGQTWSQAPIGSVKPVAVSRVGSSVVWVLAEAGGSLDVLRSADGGQTWRTMAIDSQAAIEPGGTIQFSPVSATSAAVSVPGGPVIPGGEMFLTSDSGATFTELAEPVGGDVSFGGASDALLVGGLGDDLLYSTDDAGSTWTKLSLPALASTDIPALGSTYVQDGMYYIPETIQMGSDQLSFQLLGGPVSGPFRPQAVPFPVASGSGGSLGPGTPLTTSQDGSTIWVAAPDSSQIYQSQDSGATWSAVPPSGLPAGVTELALTGSVSAIALVTGGSCAPSKSGCSRTSGVYVTSDGGATWSQSAPAG